MKPLLRLLLVLLIATGKSEAQKKNTSPNISSIHTHYGFIGEDLPDKDTLTVLFELCDTTVEYVDGNPIKRKAVDWGRIYWQRGFITEHKVSDNYNEAFWMVPDHYYYITWEPMREENIIWSWRTIKTSK